MTRKKGEPTPFTNSRIKREQSLNRSLKDKDDFEETLNGTIRISFMDAWERFGHSFWSATPKIYANTLRRHSAASRKVIIEIDEALPCQLLRKELTKCVRRIKEKVGSRKRRTD